MASKEASALLHRRACTSAYAFIAESVHAFRQVLLRTMHVQVCTSDRCFEHQRTHLPTHSLQDVQMRSCMRNLFIQRWGTRVRGGQLVYEGNFCLAWGIIFDKRSNRGVVCVFSIFNAGGSVCGCMCGYTHTHTHTAHIGYSDVSPGVGMRHLDSPKNPDELNVGIFVFVYLYKVHICTYMLGGGMRSWTNCFFSLTYLFFR